MIVAVGLALCMADRAATGSIAHRDALSLGLAAALADAFVVEPSSVQVVTSIVASGLVVEDGQTVHWSPGTAAAPRRPLGHGHDGEVVDGEGSPCAASR
jgi:hypothetical protein